jgi:Mn2+/Fe2+ NRAMP family transporter
MLRTLQAKLTSVFSRRSARIGWLSGQGLAASMRRLLPARLTALIVGLLVLANTLNISADIAAMGASPRLLTGGPETGYALAFGLLCTLLPVWLGFDAMVRVLKWLTLALLSYVAVVLMLHVNWGQVFGAERTGQWLSPCSGPRSVLT